MEKLWESYWNLMGILWNFYGIFMGFLWNFLWDFYWADDSGHYVSKLILCKIEIQRHLKLAKELLLKF